MWVERCRKEFQFSIFQYGDDSKEKLITKAKVRVPVCEDHCVKVKYMHFMDELQ